MKKTWLGISGIISFGLFVFFSFLVHKNLFNQFDFDMTVKLQDHMPRRFDDFFSFLSILGQAEVTGAILAIILILVLIFKRKWIFALISGFSFGFFHLFEIYGKTFVKHLPPPHFMLRTHELFNFSAFYVREENSYPSGHAARAIFVTLIVGFIISHTKLKHQTKLFFYAGLVAYDAVMIVSRVYLGEHWTSDVIGGTLLGSSFAFFSAILL